MKNRFVLIAAIILWSTLIIVPSIWQLISSLKWMGLSSSEAAGWVQGIGSILAIIASGLFPVIHDKLSSRRREKELSSLVRALMNDAIAKLWGLSAVFVEFESEVVKMQEYLRQHKDREWKGLLSSIDQIPMAEIPSKYVIGVGCLRDAAEFGSYVAENIPAWIHEKSSMQDVVRTLKVKRDQLMAVSDLVPGFDISSPEWSWIKDAAASEEKRPDAEILTRNMIKVYRRYAWRVTWGENPIGYKLQYFFPDGRVANGGERFFAWVNPGDIDGYIDSDIRDTIQWDIKLRQSERS